MEVTKRETNVTYHLAVTDDELVEAVGDPEGFVYKLATLTGITDVPPEDAPAKANGKPKARKAATRRPKAKDDTVPCPMCGKVVKTKGLSVHITRKHYGDQPSSSAAADAAA